MEDRKGDRKGKSGQDNNWQFWACLLGLLAVSFVICTDFVVIVIKSSLIWALDIFLKQWLLSSIDTHHLLMSRISTLFSASSFEIHNELFSTKPPWRYPFNSTYLLTSLLCPQMCLYCLFLCWGRVIEPLIYWMYVCIWGRRAGERERRKGRGMVGRNKKVWLTSLQKRYL